MAAASVFGGAWENVIKILMIDGMIWLSQRFLKTSRLAAVPLKVIFARSRTSILAPSSHPPGISLPPSAKRANPPLRLPFLPPERT